MGSAPIVAWIVRWIGFLALAGLVGGFVMDLLVLPAPSSRQGGEGRVKGRGCPSTAALGRRLRALRVGCSAVLLLVTVGELWLRAATMSGGGPGGALTAIPAVLTRTHFGRVWIMRATGLISLLALSRASTRPLQGLGALTALGVALTVSLTGHASNWGDVSVTAGLDWLHVAAATSWTGGLFVLVAVVIGEARHWPVPLLGEVMRRFSRLAAWCLLAVAVSGAYAAWVQVAGVAALWQTVYGRALVVKLLLVAGLVWWGALNRYTVLPRLAAGGGPGALERLFRRGPGSAASPPPVAASRLAGYLTREVLLALLVFGCSAVLTESTPARHAHHLGADSPMGVHAGHAIAGEGAPTSGAAPAVSR